MNPQPRNCKLLKEWPPPYPLSELRIYLHRKKYQPTLNNLLDSIQEINPDLLHGPWKILEAAGDDPFSARLVRMLRHKPDFKYSAKLLRFIRLGTPHHVKVSNTAHLQLGLVNLNYLFLISHNDLIRKVAARFENAEIKSVII